MSHLSQRHKRLSLSSARFLILGSAVFCAPLLHANTYTVGPAGTGCSYTNIQSALNAAESHSGADTVRIVYALGGTGLHGVINTGQELTIEGGYATCGSATSDGGRTIISAAGGTAYKVFSITSTGASTVRLKNLRLTDGFASGGGYGGGIYFKGPGNLVLSDVSIDNNRAGYGAGIYFEGTSPTATLTIGENNLINSNVASVSGGGIYLQNAIMIMTAANSSLLYNEAASYGGGLRMYGKSQATVSSDGYAGFAAIQGNEAAYGGGVAVQAGQDDALDAYFYLTDGARIHDNFARFSGGGMFLQPYAAILSYSRATAEIYDAVLDTNVAPQGAAAYLASDEGTFGVFGSKLNMYGGSIINNLSSDANGQATGGATIVLASSSDLDIYNTFISNNTGGAVLRNDQGGAYITSSLVTGNTMQRGLIDVLGRVGIYGSSIVGNTLAGNTVLAGAGDLKIKQSIIWQPGKQTAQAGGNRDVDDVIASEITSLPNSASIIYADPRFVDQAHNDYHLQAASPAVDFSGVVDTTGVDGASHNKDMALVANRYGAGDLGAYELPSIGNLVLNPTFVRDLRIWVPVNAGVSAWNATGAGNPGGVTISKTPVPAGGEVIGLTQCVHIPGPGTYVLDGSAHGGAEASDFRRDHPILRWRLRPNPGSENCSGTVAASADIGFPTGPNFASANRHSTILVTPAMWSRFTSIEVSLVVQEGNSNASGTTSASFDDIKLRALDTDVIFANGFEP